MKKLLSIAAVAFFSLSGFAQKTEDISLECGGKTYSFKGFRIGDAQPLNKSGYEYYYSSDGKQVNLYILNFMGNGQKYYLLKKITIPISDKLSKITFTESTMNLNTSYGGPKNIEESCDCNDGNIRKREDTYLPIFYVQFSNDNQKIDFQKVIDTINKTVEDLKSMK